MGNLCSKKPSSEEELVKRVKQLLDQTNAEFKLLNIESIRSQNEESMSKLQVQLEKINSEFRLLTIGDKNLRL